MKILIPTQVHDVHATAVARALASTGHAPVLWYGADAPTRQTVSLEIDEHGHAEFSVAGAALDAGGHFDVIWYRRPTDAELPSDMHPSDREFASGEWSRMERGVWNVLREGAFWVNPFPAAAHANAKSRQLVDARACGLAIPRTLLSSDPRRIREFVRENHGQTIYKPFCTAQWRTDDGTAYAFTAVIDEASLPDDDVLRLTPGIFQPRLEKSYELRVTIMGNHVFAVRLDSQGLEEARVDWRAGTRAIGMSPTALPADVEARCLALMSRLGLVFGCLDFIVTPSGEHVFLEVNQMGQFLWLEELLPELRLLDAFCAMLTQARPDFAWDASRAALRWCDFHDPADDEKLDAPHVAHVIFNEHDDVPREVARAV